MLTTFKAAVTPVLKARGSERRSAGNPDTAGGGAQELGVDESCRPAGAALLRLALHLVVTLDLSQEMLLPAKCCLPPSSHHTQCSTEII